MQGVWGILSTDDSGGTHIHSYLKMAPWPQDKATRSYWRYWFLLYKLHEINSFFLHTASDIERLAKTLPEMLKFKTLWTPEERLSRYTLTAASQKTLPNNTHAHDERASVVLNVIHDIKLENRFWNVVCMSSLKDSKIFSFNMVDILNTNRRRSAMMEHHVRSFNTQEKEKVPAVGKYLYKVHHQKISVSGNRSRSRCLMDNIFDTTPKRTSDCSDLSVIEVQSR